MTTAPEQVHVPVTWDDFHWQSVCPLERLQAERGVAALFGDVQVAVFRLFDGRVFAVGNIDPRSGAAVMSRGIVGDRGGVPIVASPLYKEAYSLVDGRCLDVEDVSLPTYPVRVRNGSVQIGLP
jgi:nitrite reductase (NADH) small subunit